MHEGYLRATWLIFYNIYKNCLDAGFFFNLCFRVWIYNRIGNGDVLKWYVKLWIHHCINTYKWTEHLLSFCSRVICLIVFWWSSMSVMSLGKLPQLLFDTTQSIWRIQVLEDESVSTAGWSESIKWPLSIAELICVSNIAVMLTRQDCSVSFPITHI